MRIALFSVFLTLVWCGCLREQPAETWETDEDLVWYRKPLRILQTVLREPDGEDYSVKDVIQYLEQTSSNVLVVNGGGIIDFFQNPLPAANINDFIGERDLLKDIIDSCHLHGIKVIVRVDFRGVEEHVYREYPDWFAKNRDGSSMRLEWSGNLHHACYNGYYKQEHAPRFVRHLFSRYDPDGIWHNAAGSYGICYCRDCAARFRDSTGRELPVEGESSEEEMDTYILEKAKWASGHLDEMRRTVKSFGNEKAYVAEIFGMYEEGSFRHTGIDLYNAADHFDFMISSSFINPDKQGFSYRELHYPQSIVRFMKSLKPGAQPVILYGGNGTAHRYVAEPALDTRLWLWEGLAAGGSFWNCYFMGQHPADAYDRRNAFVQTDAYRFTAEHSDLLQQQRPCGEIAVFYSRPTRFRFWSRESQEDYFGMPLRGLARILTGHHFQYKYITDYNFAPSDLDGVRLLILPNVACLSDAHADIIREFVHNGGRLLATYKSSLFDEKGRIRENFGLADLFGVTFTGAEVRSRQDFYQYIENRHPILEGFGETSLLLNWGQTLLCEPVEAEVICSYTPMIDNQPPETAWRDSFGSDHPTLVVNRYGEGEVIYCSNTPFFAAGFGGGRDFSTLAANAIRYLLEEETVLATNAPPGVHISLTVSEGEDRYILSLVNTSSTPARPVSELIPVRDLVVELRLEEGVEYRCRTLYGTAHGEQEGDGRVRVTIPAIGEFVSMAILETGSLTGN